MQRKVLAGLLFMLAPLLTNAQSYQGLPPSDYTRPRITEVRRLTTGKVTVNSRVVWEVEFSAPVTVVRDTTVRSVCLDECIPLRNPDPSRLKGGFPYLDLEIGKLRRKALYHGRANNRVVRFAYTIQSGDPATEVQVVPGTLHLPSEWMIVSDQSVFADLGLPPKALTPNRSTLRIDLLAPGMGPGLDAQVGLRFLKLVKGKPNEAKLELVATDNVGVSGFLLSELPDRPSLSSKDWVSVPPRKVLRRHVQYRRPRDFKDSEQVIHAWFRDEAGNLSPRVATLIQYQLAELGAASSMNITANVPAQNTAPHGTISLTELSPLVSASSVEVVLQATDDESVTGYYVSLDSELPPTHRFVPVTPILNLNQRVHVNLGNEDGDQRIFAWFKDQHNRISPPVSVGVQVDRTPPKGAAQTDPATGRLEDSEQNITLLAFDEMGVEAYRISHTLKTPKAHEFISVPKQRRFEKRIPWDSERSGVRLFAWFRDGAGNVSDPVMVALEPPPPPTPEATVPVAAEAPVAQPTVIVPPVYLVTPEQLKQLPLKLPEATSDPAAEPTPVAKAPPERTPTTLDRLSQSDGAHWGLIGTATAAFLLSYQQRSQHSSYVSRNLELESQVSLGQASYSSVSSEYQSNQKKITASNRTIYFLDLLTAVCLITETLLLVNAASLPDAPEAPPEDDTAQLRWHPTVAQGQLGLALSLKF